MVRAMDRPKCREYFGGFAGRQTGSVQWRATRGELGAAVAHPAAAPADAHPGAKAPTRPPPATRWRRSPAPGDRGGGLHDTGCRVRGAAVRASGDNAPAETADKVLRCTAVIRIRLSCCRQLIFATCIGCKGSAGFAYVWRAGDTLQGGLPVMQVLDGRADTKWLDFGGGAAGQTTWLEVRLCVLICSSNGSLSTLLN